MEVIKYHRTAFERQVQEACLIKWSMADPGIRNLNRKFEYNRSIIPELGKSEEPTKKEREQDEAITEKILKWKAERAKEAKEKKRALLEQKKADRRQRNLEQGSLDKWLQQEDVKRPEQTPGDS